jgi:hypothetical protein
VSDRSAGCRGVIGPVPRPLWMNTAQPRLAPDLAQQNSASWEERPHEEMASAMASRETGRARHRNRQSERAFVTSCRVAALADAPPTSTLPGLRLWNLVGRRPGGNGCASAAT